jgi:hypothetical protein
VCRQKQQQWSDASQGAELRTQKDTGFTTVIFLCSFLMVLAMIAEPDDQFLPAASAAQQRQ